MIEEGFSEIQMLPTRKTADAGGSICTWELSTHIQIRLRIDDIRLPSLLDNSDRRTDER